MIVIRKEKWGKCSSHGIEIIIGSRAPPLVIKKFQYIQAAKVCQMKSESQYSACNLKQQLRVILYVLYEYLFEKDNKKYICVYIVCVDG